MLRSLLPYLLGLALFCCSPIALGVETQNTGIQWSMMTMSLLGGLALFLFGMEQMSSSLKAIAGNRMRDILSSLTSNRFMGLFTGAFVTAILQSSSVTTVLVVGFISAGLMTLSQSIGVIIGANIGTTITAQIIAFKITKAALLMIAIGFFMLFFSKRERIRHYGTMLMGLGLVFFGMNIMSEAMAPLRDYQPFLDLMIKMENPIWGIIVAAVFTGLVQSSSATTGIIIVMASQGLITLPVGIALSFGSNIGTCITALLASIGKPRKAIQAAIVHVFFNVGGVMLWILFIPQLTDLVIWLSPVHSDLEGVSRLGADTPRQIANAHTIFNLANAFLFLGFTKQIAHFVDKILPELPESDQAPLISARFLDDDLLSTPFLALDRARREMRTMGAYVETMHELILPAIFSDNKDELLKIRSMDNDVDTIYASIIDYMGKISQQSLGKKQTREFLLMMEAINNLENINEVIGNNLVELGLKKLQLNVSISEETRQVMWDLHKIVHQTLASSIQAFSTNDIQIAQEVVSLKKEIFTQTNSAYQHQSQRLIATEPNRISTYSIEVAIIEKQKRIYYFSRRIARSVVKLPRKKSKS